MRDVVKPQVYSAPVDEGFMKRPVTPLSPVDFYPDLATKENERIEAGMRLLTPGETAIRHTIQGEQ